MPISTDRLFIGNKELNLVRSTDPIPPEGGIPLLTRKEWEKLSKFLKDRQTCVGEVTPATAAKQEQFTWEFAKAASYSVANIPWFLVDMTKCPETWTQTIYTGSVSTVKAKLCIKKVIIYPRHSAGGSGQTTTPVYLTAYDGTDGVSDAKALATTSTPIAVLTGTMPAVFTFDKGNLEIRTAENGSVKYPNVKFYFSNAPIAWNDSNPPSIPASAPTSPAIGIAAVTDLTELGDSACYNGNTKQKFMNHVAFVVETTFPGDVVE